MSTKAGRALSDALIQAATEDDPAAAGLVADQLTGLSGPGWLRLDEVTRGPRWGASPLGTVADWHESLATGGLHAAVAASMHRDGRIREAAVQVLAGLPGRVAGAALAVRAADWVPQVSVTASVAVSTRTNLDDAAAIIPVLLALGSRRRGRQAAAKYLDAIARGPAVMLAALASGEDRVVRLWALQAQADRGLLSAELLLAWAVRDRDPVVALWCARALAGPAGELPALAGERLLGSARAGVRAFAAGQVRDEQLGREVLTELLLDRSGAVRSVARWRWRRQRGDPGEVYRSVVAGGDVPRHLAAALQGLDDERDGCLPGAAVPFLAHRNPRVRRAAVQAVGHHADALGIRELLVPRLLDGSPKVAATALRYVGGRAVPDSVLAHLDAADTTQSRRFALAIRQNAGTWNRVHADLTALGGPDHALAETGRSDLLSWLQHGAAASYGRPSASQAAEIGLLLATPGLGLTDRQRRDIAFVADISPPLIP